MLNVFTTKRKIKYENNESALVFADRFEAEGSNALIPYNVALAFFLQDIPVDVATYILYIHRQIVGKKSMELWPGGKP